MENVQNKSTTEFLQPQFDERGNAYVEMIGKDDMGRGGKACPSGTKVVNTVAPEMRYSAAVK